MNRAFDEELRRRLAVMQNHTRAARLLGISVASVSRIVSGQRGAGRAITMAALAIWPEMSDLLRPRRSQRKAS